MTRLINTDDFNELAIDMINKDSVLKEKLRSKISDALDKLDLTDKIQELIDDSLDNTDDINIVEPLNEELKKRIRLLFK